jgi:uncharacterized Zn-binding protein involved in type VI secretion
MPAQCRIGDPFTCGDVEAHGSGNVFVNGIPATRINVDLTAGHCFSPVQVVSGSPNVFINVSRGGDASARVGDPHAGHCCPPACHGGNVAAGSPNVFVNDLVASGTESSYEETLLQTTDEEDPSEVGSFLPSTHPMVGEYAAQKLNASKLLGITPDTSPEEAILPGTTQTPVVVPTSCTDIFSMTSFTGNFQLSPNFTLAQLTTNTRVSNYKVRAQLGLSEQNIVCNLRALCLNILEPLVVRYGRANILINSGFRHGENGSQHNKGEAVDVAFADVNNTASINQRAEEVRSMNNYDQFIFEQNRQILQSTWYHLSYKSQSNRGSVLTKRAGNDSYLPGLYRLSIS